MPRVRRIATAAVARARWAVLAVVALLATLSFVPSSIFTVQQCIAMPKGAGWFGVHFALLRESSACSTGSYAVGGEPTAVLGIVLMVAVPILIANACATLLTFGLTRIVRSALDLVRRVVAAVVPSLPRPVVQLVRRTLYVDRRPPYLRPQRSVPPALGRAPPALAIV